jgi:hypothetical protein
LRDIFKRAFELEGNSDIAGPGYQGVLDWLRKQLGIQRESLSDGSVNFEEVISLVDLAKAFAVEVPDRPFVHLDPMYHRSTLGDVIWNVLMGANAYCASKQTCEYHDRISTSLGADDVVVNFNYDLIMDASLSKANLLGPDSCPSYGIEFKEWVSKDGVLSTPGAATLGQYYKLHGSINWLIAGQWDPNEGGTSDERIVHVPIPIFSNPSTEYLGDLFWDHFDGPAYFKPMIVPPSFLKSQSYSDPMERHWPVLWSKCAERMGNCSEWVVIGYSFGHSDMDANWLLRQAATKVRRPKISIVDPDMGRVATRIKQVLSGVDFLWGRSFHSMKEFADS